MVGGVATIKATVTVSVMDYLKCEARLALPIMRLRKKHANAAQPKDQFGAP
jgi:hypothetical protein